MNKAEEIAQEIHKIENGDLPEFIKNRNNQNQIGKVKKNQEKSAKKVQQTKSTQTQSTSEGEKKGSLMNKIFIVIGIIFFGLFCYLKFK